MEGSVKLDLDKLPIKRLYAIDELGNEQFPAEIDHEEKRLDMIRRIDFSWVVEKDAKKQKSSKDSVSQPVWQWQGLVENLRLAHEELSIILDLINTVEANDAVTVAGMQRPKQLPHEALSDIAVSAATKLQRLRHLGRYFKQSSKALEQQVVREARFYGSLISLSYRLQQNWKVKRQRLAAAGPGSDGFTIDLLDSSLPDQLSLSRPSSFSSVRVDHNSAGVLAVQLPLRSCRSICLRFLGAQSSYKPRSFGNSTMCSAGQSSGEVKKDIFTDDDAQRCVKDAHTILREIHRSIFEEQVFDMVNREMYNPSPGVNVTGMREDFLQLDIGQESSICLCLMVSGKQDNTQPTNSTGQTENGEGGVTNADSLALTVLPEKYDTRKSLPNPVSLEIFLQDMFHRNVVTRVKERCKSASRHLMSGQRAGDKNGLLCHFCMAISHRIFANRVLSKLECLVSRVPYLHLLSQPTWHSRTSSWTLIWNVPQSVLRYGSRTKPLDAKNARTGIKSQFHTKVVVNDDRISVSGEGAPSVIGSFRSDSLDACAVNCYSCDLEDLSMILLQQVAGQVIRWLHEEASVVGMKASRDFLCLYFDLDQGETLGLVAQVDPHDFQGCISWWVVLDDGSMDEGRLSPDKDEWENRGRYLGHLSLETLYSTLMDLVNLCSSGGSR